MELRNIFHVRRPWKKDILLFPVHCTKVEILFLTQTTMHWIVLADYSVLYVNVLFFLTPELNLRSEKSLPRVVFGDAVRMGTCLPWVLLRWTDKDEGGEIQIRQV